MSTAAKMIREQKTLLPKDAPVPNRRILVIDDEPEIGQAIKRILTPEDKAAPTSRRSSRSANLQVVSTENSMPTFELVVCTNPSEALAAVRDSVSENRPFSMGFFDVVLNAEIDGIELVKQVLAIDPKMFAVFVTAYQDRTVDKIGSFLGEDNLEKWDYINKPFTEGEILQKARSISSLWDLHRLKEWQAVRLAEAHQLLLQSERQNAVAAVGRSVAHEFGNLLTHIVGNAELAIESGKPDGMKNALELILKASDTATNILKRFRNMHGNGEKLPDPSLVDAWQVLEEALELMDFQLRKHLIVVTKSKRVALPVLAHKHALVQVLVNIFINAQHALPGGGNIKLDVKVENEEGVISIRDSGPGIPEDILPRVHEPLFTTKGAEGSGLGLAIVKEIVEIEHHGQLIIQNHPEGGAQIIIRLPLYAGRKK